MRVYVAGASSEIERAEKWMAALRAAGIEVTSTWPEVIRSQPRGEANPMDVSREQRAIWSATDLAEVSNADVFWRLLGKISEGANVEMGYAVMLAATAQQARALGIEGAPNFWLLVSGVETSIFTALADHFETDEKAFEALKVRNTLFGMAAKTKAQQPFVGEFGGEGG